jgi:hypothetical protein
MIIYPNVSSSTHFPMAENLSLEWEPMDYLLHEPSSGVAAAPVYLIDKAGPLLSWGRVTGLITASFTNVARVFNTPHSCIESTFRIQR